MDRRKLSLFLTISLMLTGSLGAANTYASEELNIVSEVLETVPENDSVIREEGSEIRDGVVSGTYKTMPVSEDAKDALEDSSQYPEGVVQMVVRTTPVDEYGNEAKGTETQEITGNSSMPDASELGLYAKDIVNMVMPVVPEDTYDFVMDTDDLLSRFSIYKDRYEQASLYFTNTMGEKTHTCISDAAMAKNKSSVPVLLYVTLQVENENGWPINYTDMDSVESDNEKNISFALVPVSTNAVVLDDNGDFSKAEDTEAEETDTEDLKTDGNKQEDYVICKDSKISIDETGKAEMILYLPGTPDNFDVINDKYMAKEDAVWSSLGFAVTGACNTRADWSEMDERSNAGEMLRIHVSYRMDLLSKEQEEMIANGLNPDPETGVIAFDAAESEEENEEDEGINDAEIASENQEGNIGSDTEDDKKVDTEENEDKYVEDKDSKHEHVDESIKDNKEEITDEL